MWPSHDILSALLGGTRRAIKNKDGDDKHVEEVGKAIEQSPEFWILPHLRVVRIEEGSLALVNPDAKKHNKIRQLQETLNIAPCINSNDLGFNPE